MTSGPQPDLAFTLAEQLLGHIKDRLTGDIPKRIYVYAGSAVPADDCCAGMLWIRVGQVEPTAADGNTYRLMLNAGTPVPGHNVLLEVGVLRCGPIIDEQGYAPTGADFTAAAMQAAADRQAMRLAVLCDFPADLIAANADGQIPSTWIPIEAADCVGGYMTVIVGTSIVI